ncbi:MAG: TIR domain-containing protein [Bacteroidales bacterium]|nr:TIR domain-containing protein [Clostridium sp.]MCM1203005.1 TIR domain-containing protein [Bacteroidales bacterium]
MAEKKYVFVSYSSRDGKYVNPIVKLLEESGIYCWKAPEMIPAGSSYAREIPRAIKDCSVFLLMLSKTSQDSIWVEKEIDNAISNRKDIIPFQLDETPLNETFRFYLNNVQMISYLQNPKEAKKELKNQISCLLGLGDAQDASVKEFSEEADTANANQQEIAWGKNARKSFARRPGNSNALRINRIPLECACCGSRALDNISMGIYRCRQCGLDNFDDFQTIRNYLDKVGNASAVVIERDTGVPKRVIDYFFREEYLEIPKNSPVRVPCERCGAPIRTGVLCEECKKKKTDKNDNDRRGSWHSIW